MSPDGQNIDVVRKAATLWTSEDDLGSEESRETVSRYRSSEFRKLAFTFASVSYTHLTLPTIA